MKTASADMASSAARRGVRGGGISIAGQGAKIILQVVGTVVLSRLLSPADFGLFAMVAVFVSLGELLRDFGLPTAALQRSELTHPQASNLFWANTALGLLVAGVLVVCGPLIALLYAEPRLQEILPVMAAVSVLNGMQAQIQVGLVKSMRFLALAVTDVTAQTAAYAAGIACAAFGMGYRALVVQALLGAAVQLVARWVLAGWRPQWPQRRQGTFALVRNGVNFGIANLLTFASSNIDTVMIGARLGAVELGFYNRAFQLLMSPISRLVAPLSEVAIPTLQGSVAERRSVQPLLLRAQSLLALVLVGVFMTLATASQWLIPWVLGNQWAPSIPIFNALAAGGCFWALSNVSLWSFVVLCESRELLRYNLVTKTATIVMIVIASSFGAEAVAWAFTVSLMLSWPLNVWWLDRKAGLAASAFLRNGAAILVPALASYALVRLFQFVVGAALADHALALISIGAAAALYLGFIAVTSSGRATLRTAVYDVSRMMGLGNAAGR